MAGADWSCRQKGEGQSPCPPPRGHPPSADGLIEHKLEANVRLDGLYRLWNWISNLSSHALCFCFLLCYFFFAGYLLGGVCVPCMYRMPGGVIVGETGLCCCGPVQCVTSIVRAQLLPSVCYLFGCLTFNRFLVKSGKSPKPFLGQAGQSRSSRPNTINGDVDCSSAVDSLGLLILQKRSGPPGSDCS